MNRLKATIYKTLLFGSLFASTLLSGINVTHAALAVDFSGAVAANGLVENGGPSTFGASSGYSIVGWSFTPMYDLYLNRLGVYDADRDRIHSESHLVGLWSAANSSLLTSVTIDESQMNVPEISPNGARFHFVNTASPVVLHSGQTYIVGATMYAGAVAGGAANDFDSFAAFDNGESPISFNPYILYLGNAYAINATNSLVMPTSSFVTDYTIGANFDATPTPIPAAAWLFGSGIMGLVGIRRRMK